MRIRFIIVSTVIFLMTILSFHAQDTLSVASLSELTHSFQLEEGAWRGDGAEFLIKEIAASQFTILGDYVDSENIAEFTSALVPKLRELEYNMLALDIGPTSVDVLEQLPLCNKDISEAVFTLNNRYGFKEKDRIHLPIPILRTAEELTYIKTAIDNEWNLIGLNNDSWNALLLLLDELNYNLPETDHLNNKELYENARKALEELYLERDGDLVSFADNFKKNEVITEFLTMASASDKNAKILGSISYSLLKSQQYAEKKYFEKNRDRIPFEKEILRGQLEANDFDITKDKMLVKVNRRHAAKGFQPDGFYGFANTLYEMASYQGNKSIYIGFFKRFYLEDKTVKDEMDRDYYITDRYGEIIQMGQKDAWTIVDLRPLIEGSYYVGKYSLSPWISDLMKQYDLIIIPPIEQPTQNNHSLAVD